MFASAFIPLVSKSNGTPQFEDGREEKFLEYVSSHMKDEPTSDLPRQVVQLIDDFGVHHSYMMNVGARKGNIFSDLITKHKPTNMIELGSYVGYLTVFFLQL